MPQTDEQKIQELLSRGVEEVIVKESLEKKLLSGQKLRVYWGVDPTGARLHLGHAILLWKLRAFQELGHEVILLIGDFTAKIGDPTDKDAMRVPLSDKQIKENFKDYKKQASKVLNFSKVKVKYNSAWLSKLRFEDILKLSSHFTVQQMLHRDMFDKRMKENAPINQTEFMYPLMQGYDSVAMDVDVEIGASDQMFNMLAGRTLQKAYNHKDKDVLMVRLLLGTDGRKMSKTYDNAIYLDDAPNDMFGKIMSMKDELIADYFELSTGLTEPEILEIKKMPNPRDQKALLAKEIVKMYHGEVTATEAADNFDKVFRRHETPEEIPVFETSQTNWPILDLLVESALAESKNDAKRVIEGGGVTIISNSGASPFQDKFQISNWSESVEIHDGMVIKFGKRKFIKIKLK